MRGLRVRGTIEPTKPKRTGLDKGLVLSKELMTYRIRAWSLPLSRSLTHPISCPMKLTSSIRALPLRWRCRTQAAILHGPPPHPFPLP